MRNLTLGALIVFGGILAALPFRKAPSSSSGDADQRTLATGPSADLAVTSELVPYDQFFAPQSMQSDNSPANHPHSGPAGSPASMTSATASSMASTTASSMRSPERMRGIPSDAVASPRRDLRLPLTYDDLAVPLATPHFNDGRFNALASRQADAMPPGRTKEPASPAAFETFQASDSPQQRNRPPAPWEMSKTLPESILQVTPPTVTSPPKSTGPVQGRLASDSQPRVGPPAAMPTNNQPPARERHWIRQPD